MPTCPFLSPQRLTGPEEGPSFGKYRHLYRQVMPCDFEVTVDQEAFELLSAAYQVK